MPFEAVLHRVSVARGLHTGRSEKLTCWSTSASVRWPDPGMGIPTASPQCGLPAVWARPVAIARR